MSDSVLRTDILSASLTETAEKIKRAVKDNKKPETLFARIG
jgi:hypothetical protein